MSSPPAVDVIVPYRATDQWRATALERVVQEYSIGGDYRVLIGEHADGPWRKALAVASGLQHSDSDVVIIHDADVLVDPQALAATVAATRVSQIWGCPHRTVRRLAAAPTATCCAGTAPNLGMDLDEPQHAAHLGGGIIVIRRSAYDECPLDPRFEGWGHEDDAWALALRTLHGKAYRGHAVLWHLWHPSQDRPSRRMGAPESFALYRQYSAASGRPAAMRSVVAAAGAATLAVMG